MAEYFKLAEPWSWLLGQQQSLSSPDPVDGSGSPRILLDASHKPPIATLPNGQTPLPTSSFPFILGAMRAQAFHLPTDPRAHPDKDNFPLSLLIADSPVEVRQTHLVPRPAEKGPEHPDGLTPGHVVATWIDWQVWAFQELGRVPEFPGEFDASTRAAAVRRTWDAASQMWFRDGSHKARMALIVRLSKEQPLHRALAAISMHPRRILQRYRDTTPISRVRELDAACIRDYARRPGITAAEKAGSRQRLLAVRRREQRDTMENRVACWVLERLALRSAAYSSENSGYPDDEKVKLVGRFGRNAFDWRQSELLHDIERLRQIVTQPNYPLQFEARYQMVWKTYLRLLKEKREIDDAWTWQRVLWGETGRQLLGCFLHQSLTAKTVSTPFYRTESRHGCWTELPIAPGPFQTPQGDCLVFDCRDLDSSSGRQRVRWLEQPPPCLPGAQYIGASGCDQILLWPKLNRALLVWHSYHAAFTHSIKDIQGILTRCGEALEVLASDMRRFGQSNLRLSGLLLIADLARVVAKESRPELRTLALEPGPRLASGGSVNALCVPPDVDTWPGFAADFRGALQLAMEEFLG